MGEWHSNMYNITGCLGLVHWDDPEGWYGEGGGFRMGNTCIPMADHVDIWQNQYNIVKLKNKMKKIIEKNFKQLLKITFRLQFLRNVG